MKVEKSPKPTRKQLDARIASLEAQLVHRLESASQNLPKCGKNRMMASAVILRITALDGREIVSPVAIRNGLSEAAILALCADLRDSFTYVTELSPLTDEQVKKIGK